MRAGLGQRGGTGKADAAAGAGDQCAAAVKTQGGRARQDHRTPEPLRMPNVLHRTIGH